MRIKLHTSTDCELRDRHFVLFDRYDGGQHWLPIMAFARSVAYQRDDANVLTIVGSDGNTTHHSPVRNIRIMAAAK
jgi:hypothetical protein